jgi:hypothetical protein
MMSGTEKVRVALRDPRTKTADIAYAAGTSDEALGAFSAGGELPMHILAGVAMALFQGLLYLDIETDELKSVGSRTDAQPCGVHPPLAKYIPAHIHDKGLVPIREATVLRGGIGSSERDREEQARTGWRHA